MAQERRKVGEIVWMDLTVDDATSMRDFYSEVVGWTATPFDMGGYDDFCMNVPATGDMVTGVCNARGTNAGLPPVWLMYVVVEDLDRSIARCKDLGGELISGPKNMGDDRYCIVRDPAGASLALYQYGKDTSK